MDSRGQVSVEYLFIILIFLIILTTITIPFATKSIQSSENISVTSDAQTALSTLTNAVDVVYNNGPQSSRTVNVYFPQTAALGYNATTSDLTLNLNNVMYSNNSSVNTNNINNSVMNAAEPTNITVILLNSGGNVNIGWHTFQITWPVGGNVIINETS